MSQQSSLVGRTLGQYQIVELVGEGGMAAIYKAWQPSLKRYVALKVLAPRLSNESEFLKRFHQEAVAAANLKHTHIVTVYDVGVEGDYHYMAMEFIEGTSLQERLRSGQAFTLDEVVDVVSQVGSALDYAHQRGFIHRDIKPANILIESSGRAVLTDFGIVKALSESGVTSALTQAGTIVGTPQYMSPEQVKDEPLDHRSDLYSLGIVCFEMLSGQVPFDGTTTHAILYAQVNTPPPPLRKFSGLEVPAPVEAAMNKMLAKDRDSRYNSAGEFARDLTQAVAGVWPAGIGGETTVVGQMGTGTAVVGGAAGGASPVTPGGMPAPTVRPPAGPPTPPPTVRQPTGPQQIPSYPPTGEKRRSGLMRGLVVGGIVLVLLVLAVVGGGVLLWPRLFGGAAVETPTATLEVPTATAQVPTVTAQVPTVTAQVPTADAERVATTIETPAIERIVFTSERDGNAEIYVMNTNGSGQRNLTNSPSGDYWPRWSPDGSKIVFHSYEPSDVGGNAEIYVMDANGTNWVRLTRSQASDKFADWSPDGKEIVFVSDRDGNSEIYVMNSDGSQIRRLTDHPAMEYFPMWSPDGREILFESDRDGNLEIYVMNADGTNLINLTRNPAKDSMASWSPDGTQIAFTSNRSGQPEVWVMNNKGSNPARLISEEGQQPRWSPDGKKIVFFSARDGNQEIYVMNADGGDQIRLTNSGANDRDACWARFYE